MTQNFEFLKYQTAPAGEKFLGIATVRYLGKIILRYKIIEDKNGGYFPAEGSFKFGNNSKGEDLYPKYFKLDSDWEKEQMAEFIMDNVEKAMKNLQNSSVFNQNTHHRVNTPTESNSQPWPNLEPSQKHEEVKW